MIYRCAGAGLAAAGLVMCAPLAAQTTNTGTAAPPRDPQAQPTVSPEQVIGVIKGLIKPKPSPTVFPTPTPAPTFQPTSTPTAAPTPRPVATTVPVGTVRPTPIVQPSTAAPLPSAMASNTPAPPATVVEPLPETAVVAPQTTPIELSALPRTGPPVPWWVWLIVAGAAGGLAELARRWFWPKPTIGCEIAVGPGTLTFAANPAFTAPEIDIVIRIEAGEASAPIGQPVLAQGDTA